MVEQKHIKEYNTVLRMLTGDFNPNPDYIKGPDGKMQGSRPGRGSGKKKSRFLHGKVAHDLFSDHPRLPIGTKGFMYEHGDHFYIVDVVGWGEYECRRKIRIHGNEERIKKYKQLYGRE